MGKNPKFWIRFRSGSLMTRVRFCSGSEYFSKKVRVRFELSLQATAAGPTTGGIAQPTCKVRFDTTFSWRTSFLAFSCAN